MEAPDPGMSQVLRLELEREQLSSQAGEQEEEGREQEEEGRERSAQAQLQLQKEGAPSPASSPAPASGNTHGSSHGKPAGSGGELRLSRRRTKSLPCLRDPSDYRTDLHGGLRKKVKFADSLGLSLASVKHFRATDEPHVPTKVFMRLRSFSIVDDLNENFKALGMHWLRAAFLMPGDSGDFMQRVERDKVCLERLTVSHFEVHGLVRVLNLAHVKDVSVRYSFNNWLSFLDSPAVCLERLAAKEQGATDRFSFSLSLPPFMDQGSFVHFAICYRTEHEEFWDNNLGKNYALQCEARSDEHANT